MEQIFNADETTLYYYVPQHTYLSTNDKLPSSGLNESKQRVTLLSCVNAAAVTCKIKLTVIGKSKKHYSFKKEINKILLITKPTKQKG